MPKTDVPWLRHAISGEISLSLHVQPGAKRTEFCGTYGDALKLRLAAPPVDGKANECLIEYLARELGVPRSAVRIVSGETARRKIVRVIGVEPERLERLCQAAGS